MSKLVFAARKLDTVRPEDIDPEAPHELPYLGRCEVSPRTVTFAHGYSQEFVRRASTRPGPRECFILPGQPSLAKEVVEFLKGLYRELPEVMSPSSAPEGKLANYGESYGNISPLLTAMGWPSSPFGTSLPNGAAYARERVVAAGDKYKELLATLLGQRNRVTDDREAYLRTGELSEATLRVVDYRCAWFAEKLRPADKLTTRRDTNAGPPTLLSSALYKQYTLNLALENGMRAHYLIMDGSLSKAAELGVVAMYMQGFRYQNDGGKKGERIAQPVSLPDGLMARNREVLSLWRAMLVIANKMSPHEALAAERCRSIQAPGMPAGFILQLLAYWGDELRKLVPAMEFLDAIKEITARINSKGAWTDESVCGTADFTGADNCHCIELMLRVSERLFGAVGRNAHTLSTILGFAPSAVFSDEMGKAGGFLNGDPLNPDTFGQLFVLASGKGTTALEVLVYTAIYLEDALIRLFADTKEPFTSEEFTALLMDAHPKYTLTLKGDGWLITVHQPSGERKKIEENIHHLLPAACVYMEAGFTRDLGGYEVYRRGSEVVVTNSAASWVNKISLGDKTFDPRRRPYAAYGWQQSLEIYGSHPLMAGGVDSVILKRYDDVGRRTLGYSPVERILQDVREPDDDLGLGSAAALLREDPSRMTWDPRYMTPEWRARAKQYYVECPEGLIGVGNDLLTSDTGSTAFADAIRGRMVSAWRSTFKAMYGKERADAQLFPMTRVQIGEILTARSTKSVAEGDALDDMDL